MAGSVNTLTLNGTVIPVGTWAGVSSLSIGAIIVAAPTPTALVALDADATQDTVSILFNNNVALSGPATEPSAWTITGDTGAQLLVTEVSSVDDTVRLTVSGMKGSDVYTIRFPAGIIKPLDGTALAPPYTVSFVGVGVNLGLNTAHSLDARTIQVIFAEKPLESDALQVGNYTVNKSIVVHSVTKNTDLVYVLKTSRQVAGTTYTVTANVRDADGNL